LRVRLNARNFWANTRDFNKFEFNTTNQIIKVWVRKSSKDLSITWLWYFLIMHMSWVVFNATRPNSRIYLMNAILLGILTAVLLVLTYKYRRGKV